MTKEIFVSSTPHETKVGLVEDDQLAEVYLERENEYTLAGSIYKGRVTRVLPGMQSAFVDIGLERDAFLYVSDFFEDNEEYDAVVSTVEEKVLKMEKGAGGAAGRETAAAEKPQESIEPEAEAAEPLGPVLVGPPVPAAERRGEPQSDGHPAPPGGG